MTAPGQSLANPSMQLRKPQTAAERQRKSRERKALGLGRVRERSLGRSGLPRRVIDYLSEYGPGIEKSSSVICEDLEIEYTKLRNSMVTAVDRGIVTKRLVGAELHWSVPARKVGA